MQLEGVSHIADEAGWNLMELGVSELMLDRFPKIEFQMIELIPKNKTYWFLKMNFKHSRTFPIQSRRGLLGNSN